MEANNNNQQNSLSPLSTSLERGSAIGNNITFTITRGTRYLYFSVDAANKLGIIAGDRVGLLTDTNNELNNYIYITNNTIGTAVVKKYKGYPYRVDWAKMCMYLQNAFRLTEPGFSIKVYINMDISIKIMINGVYETCYLLTTSVSERNDIDDFIKESIADEYKKIINGSLIKNNKQ